MCRVAALHYVAIFTRPRRYSRTHCNQRDTNDAEVVTWTENFKVGGRGIWEFSVKHTENGENTLALFQMGIECTQCLQ